MTSTITIPKNNKISKLKKIDFYNIFLSIISLLIFSAIILLVVNPTRYISSINAGIRLFFFNVFPSLLPFIFLTKILEELGVFLSLSKKFSNLTHLPSLSFYTMIVSFICGYPLGAKTIGELSDNLLIDSEEAKKLICLSSTSGPVFVVGIVGVSMFNSYFFGVLVYVCHILGTTLTGLIYLKLLKPKFNSFNRFIPKNPDKNMLYKATTTTISSVAIVAVYVSVFYMFIDMAFDVGLLKFLSIFFEKILSAVNIEPNFANCLASGIIEMTRGVKELSLLQTNPTNLAMTTSLISFGGLSIILQSLTFLKNCEIKTTWFILFKISQAILSFFIALGIGLLFVDFL